MHSARRDRLADPREARVLRHAYAALAASVVCAVWFGAGIGADVGRPSTGEVTAR
jgi:hypothetical protein